MTQQQLIAQQTEKETRTLLFLSIYLVVFFIIACIIYVFKVDFVLIGVFWELLMLPSLLLMLILPVYTFIRWWQNDKPSAYLGVMALQSLAGGVIAYLTWFA